MTLMQRRWKTFQQNKKAYGSLWIFMALFVMCLAAPLICNEKPLVVSYRHHLSFPFLFYYPETAFGGDYDLEFDYKSPEFSAAVRAEKGWVLWAPVRYSGSTMTIERQAPAAPNAENLLGTDDQGRDVFTRLLYGLRTALVFGLLLAVASSLIGIVAGAIQGYFGGWVDLCFQRFIEIWSGIPVLYILMILASLTQPTLLGLLVILTAFSWVGLASLVRAEFLRARNFTYVKAAQVLGVGPPAIIFRHILPNSIASTLSYFPFLVMSSIMTLTSLDFLGFGLAPGTPSLGELLQQGKANLYAPWLGLTGFFGVAFLLTLITFIGEGMRDAFDPQ